MKSLEYLLMFSVVFFTACKVKKNIVDDGAIAKKMTTKKIIKKHLASNFDRKTIDAKLKVNFDNGKTKQSLSVSMRIKKDEVIWLKGTKFITVFKAKITPTSVSYYSPYAKHYFEGDFSMLYKILGIEVDFQQIQNMLLGEPLMAIEDKKQNVEIIDNLYVLSPKKQSKLFDIFFFINPAHFKLEKQSVFSSYNNSNLNIAYPSYESIDNRLFPRKIELKAKQNDDYTHIVFTVKTVVFDTQLTMPFAIPKGYKRLYF